MHKQADKTAKGRKKIGKLSYYPFNVASRLLVFHPFTYFCSNKKHRYYETRMAPSYFSF